MTTNIWTTFAVYKRHQHELEAASRAGNAFARQIVAQADKVNGLMVDAKAAESFARNLRRWIETRQEREQS